VTTPCKWCRVPLTFEREGQRWIALEADGQRHWCSRYPASARTRTDHSTEPASTQSPSAARTPVPPAAPRPPVSRDIRDAGPDDEWGLKVACYVFRHPVVTTLAVLSLLIGGVVVHSPRAGTNPNDPGPAVSLGRHVLDLTPTRPLPWLIGGAAMLIYFLAWWRLPLGRPPSARYVALGIVLSLPFALLVVPAAIAWNRPSQVSLRASERAVAAAFYSYRQCGPSRTNCNSDAAATLSAKLESARVAVDRAWPSGCADMSHQRDLYEKTASRASDWSVDPRQSVARSVAGDYNRWIAAVRDLPNFC
jgi:hypothetical protein